MNGHLVAEEVEEVKLLFLRKEKMTVLQETIRRIIELKEELSKVISDIGISKQVLRLQVNVVNGDLYDDAVVEI